MAAMSDRITRVTPAPACIECGEPSATHARPCPAVGVGIDGGKSPLASVVVSAISVLEILDGSIMTTGQVGAVLDLVQAIRACGLEECPDWNMERESETTWRFKKGA